MAISDGYYHDDNEEYSRPKGLKCPYCGINNCTKATMINEYLVWICDECYEDIIAYELFQAEIRKDRKLF